MLKNSTKGSVQGLDNTVRGGEESKLNKRATKPPKLLNFDFAEAHPYLFFIQSPANSIKMKIYFPLIQVPIPILMPDIRYPLWIQEDNFGIW